MKAQKVYHVEKLTKILTNCKVIRSIVDYSKNT